MSGVQFGQQIDMNGFKVTELATGVAGTDAVNVAQLEAFAGGFAQNLGDGIATTFNINHAFALTDKNDFLARVAEVSSGAEYNVEVIGVDLNNASVTFGSPPAANAYRVAMVPVR